MAANENGAAPAAPALSKGLLFSMAAAAGVAVANIYYNQPMLGDLQRDLAGDSTSMIPTATQLGYALGLVLMVPLGDLIERKKLILWQFLFLAAALVAAALAPNGLMMLVASLAIGVGATVAQQVVPLAAHLSAPEKRGATVGTVMAGLFSGILLSRAVAGYVASVAGWRAMFWLAVPAVLLMTAWLAYRLPRSQPDSGLRYSTLMRSLISLWRELPALRVAAVTQGLLFAAFSAFWATLALHLESPAYGMGSDIAGLFGIVGLVGIMVAPMAGRIADKKGPHGVILLGAIFTLVAWLMFGLWLSMIGLVVGVIVIDFAHQGALISNQHIIYALKPEARARINTIFVGSMFMGGAAGSGIAAIAWAEGGWAAVSGFGMLMGALALILQLVAKRQRA